MSTLPLLITTERTPITLREFLTEMEKAIARNPWLADAPLRTELQIEGPEGHVENHVHENVTSVSAGCSASTHYILLK